MFIYRYNWQKPPIYKAVLTARMAELRQCDLLANGGLLLAEWNALVVSRSLVDGLVGLC